MIHQPQNYPSSPVFDWKVQRSERNFDFSLRKPLTWHPPMKRASWPHYVRLIIAWWAEIKVVADSDLYRAYQAALQEKMKHTKQKVWVLLWDTTPTPLSHPSLEEIRETYFKHQ